jgi:DnaK suppressor protein
MTSEASPDLAALRAALVARLATLRDASETTADDRRPVELDQTSVGRVSRIDAGEYGNCIACGVEIAAKRLAVDPVIATCIACASGAGM